MAIRNLRLVGDEILRKKSKEVTEMTPKLEILIHDMFDTMHEANGAGLAAVQVGVLKRIFVVDTGEEGEAYAFINPVLLECKDTQTGGEGCLSLPGKTATVTRPNYVKVRALNQNMKEFEVEGTELLARAICHEYDHLDGKIYVDLAESEVMDSEAYYEKYNKDESEPNKKSRRSSR